MTTTEKLSILRLLVMERANMCERVVETASMFYEHAAPDSVFSDMYERKMTAANAVSGFCYELLEIIDNLEGED